MNAFDDAELERYYRQIEARTSGASARRRAVRDEAADRPAVQECPTPDKAAYDDQDAAWLAVAVMRAGRLRTPDLDVYRCRCGLWHITSRREH